MLNWPVWVLLGDCTACCHCQVDSTRTVFQCWASHMCALLQHLRTLRCLVGCVTYEGALRQQQQSGHRQPSGAACSGTGIIVVVATNAVLHDVGCGRCGSATARCASWRPALSVATGVNAGQTRCPCLHDCAACRYGCWRTGSIG